MKHQTKMLLRTACRRTRGALSCLSVRRLRPRPRRCRRTEHMDLAREIFSELIEINTTNSERGNNTTAARALARAWLLDAGFPAEDVHVLCSRTTHRPRATWSRATGGATPDREPILLLAHIDVVEALPEDWSPGSRTRSSSSSAMATTTGAGSPTTRTRPRSTSANFIRMRQEGFVPGSRHHRGAHRRRGGAARATEFAFLLEEHRDLIDAAYALNEGGGGMEQNGRKISNNVQAAEKKYQSFTFRATNPGGHSSLRYGRTRSTISPRRCSRFRTTTSRSCSTR